MNSDKQKSYFIYILLCKGNTYYTGYTDNVEKRFETHKAGKGAKYTKAFPPIKILYTQEFKTKSEAMRAEAMIKRLTRKQKDELIRKGWPH